MVKRQRAPFNQTDVAQLIVGAAVLAYPLATTEEIWNLSEESHLGRAILLSLASLVFISWFTYRRYYHGELDTKRGELFNRVAAAYLITLLVATGILIAIDRWPILTDPAVATKRTILVAFAGSFSATVVDSLD